MKFSKFLDIEKNNLVPIIDDCEYSIAGVQNYGKGIVIRKKILGRELTMKKYQLIKPDQLMWCKVDTKNGAFGITTKEHEGALASTNMCLANINIDIIYPPLLELVFSIKWFYEDINNKSTGTTNRKYLTPQQILTELSFPEFSINKQKSIVEKYNALVNSGLLIEINSQLSNIQLLRQAILQEAVQGKLVSQDPIDEPASELLKRIKAEKAKQAKKGKTDTYEPITDVPYEIPKGWVWCRLGELCSKIGSGSTPRGGRDVYKTSGIKFIRSQNVYNDGLHFDSVAFIDKETHQKMHGTKVIANDILLNITGGSIGRCALVPLDFDEANVSQHVTIVRPIDNLNNEYLHKLVLSPYFQDLIMAVQTGGNREGLAKKNMELMGIPLPPLNEQKRIVTKVQQLMQLCDELEAQVQQSKADAEKLLQAVLREAFEGNKKYNTENTALSLAAEP